MIPTIANHTVNVRLSFLFAQHPEIVPPPYVAPLIPTHPFVEIPHINFWGPGASMTTPKLLTDGFTPAQLGHDCGIGIIHVGIPPGPISPVNTAASFCKVVFAAGTVQSQGKPTAGHLPPLINMLQCFAPVPLPIGMLLLIPNTVIVGMTFLDILMGAIRIAIAIVIALIFRRLGNSNGRLGNAWQSIGRFGERFNAAGFFGAMGNGLLAGAAEDIAKIPLGIVMEGKIALPYQIAEFDLTNGQAKIFYWNVGGENWQPVQNYSVGGLLTSAQTPSTTPSSASPAQQATSGVPTLGG
jgi:hypothetical protein